MTNNRPICSEDCRIRQSYAFGQLDFGCILATIATHKSHEPATSERYVRIDMNSTVTIHHASDFTAPAVAGLRIVGKDRVYWFREVCGETGALDIGRTSQRCIRIRDESVSIRHCIIRPRRDDGRYEIFDTRSRNGIRVSERPGFRPYRKVQHHVLEVGMFIKLGRVYLVAVGEDGTVPLLAYRLSQFARLALRAYGTVVRVVDKVGFTRYQAEQNKKKLDAMNADARVEEEQ